MIFGILKWFFAIFIALLLVVIAGSLLDLFTEDTCIQTTSDFIVNKFFPGGYFYN